MLNAIEDYRNEFKVKLTNKFEEEVVAFLNAKGGNVFIGIADNGNIVGIDGDADLLQRTIKDRIKDKIMPSTLGLYEVIVHESGNKKYIQVIVARGNERPYYLKDLGMTPEGCFIRIGSSIQNMPNELVVNEFSKRTRNSIKNIVSPEQNLSFSQLKIYYEEKGKIINKNFLKQLGLFTEDGKYNLNAYLLSDNNTISVRFGKYSGTSVDNLIECEDFGNCSIIKATNNILDKIKNENKTFTKIEYPERKEIKMYDYDAVREAVINAMAHNDWTNLFAPKFEMFSDRLVISSYGGIQDSVTQDEFLEGFSTPKNPELMKVFYDLDLVEQMGTGIIKILKVYDRSSFEFFPNFIRVTFKFNKNNFINKEVIEEEPLYISTTHGYIIKLMKENPRITQKELSNILGITIRTVQRNIRYLIDNKIIKRDGGDKGGKWEVIKEIDNTIELP